MMDYHCKLVENLLIILLRRRLWNIYVREQYLNCELVKFLFSKLTIGATVFNAFIFSWVLPQIILMWFSKCSLLPMFTQRSFSDLLLLICVVRILTSSFWSLLIKIWNLLKFSYILLSLNHLEIASGL